MSGQFATSLSRSWLNRRGLSLSKQRLMNCGRRWRTSVHMRRHCTWLTTSRSNSRKKFINIINAESTRLGRFVDELLNLSKMDAGSVTVSRHETDFERLLQESIEHTRPQIEARQLVFETQIPAKLPHLALDKDKIAACLVNVLGNAAKYTPRRWQDSIDC